MRLAVIGAGTVGRAFARSMVEFHEVRVHDVRPERSTHGLDEALDSDLVFLALPTPQRQGSLACDTSLIEHFLDSLPRAIQKDGNFVLRSTVPIGTTRRLRHEFMMPSLIHSPEFLTARCAVADAMVPSRNIIGGHVCEASVLLGQLYESRFPGIPLFTMPSDESEAVKLFLNGFFATKLSYFNECREFSDKLGLDWDTVMHALLADGRLTRNHTMVPGPDGKRGFGPDNPSACLPKDSASLFHQMNEAGLDAHTIRGAVLTNWRIRGNVGA
jgi:UDPglucose 6-dehydrogenase